ncbi:hypothetical protein [Comamonas odontotermitis]|uniref:hypothetical protein n=1 Tax=Comamonas odontotermitis TaxID=379895 RepID=UPI0037527690
MSYPLINGAAINTNGESASGTPSIRLVVTGQHQAEFLLEGLGSHPLRLGPLRAKVGFDVNLVIPSIRLVKTEYHSALQNQTPSHTDVLAKSTFPLVLGTPRAEAGPVSATALGTTPLRLGTPSANPIAFAAGAQPLSLGQPAAARVGFAASSQPLRLGAPSAVATVHVPSLRLVRAGKASIVVDALESIAQSAHPLTLGTPSAHRIAFVRQSIALRLTPPTVHRGTEC